MARRDVVGDWVNQQEIGAEVFARGVFDGIFVEDVEARGTETFVQQCFHAASHQSAVKGGNPKGLRMPGRNRSLPFPHRLNAGFDAVGVQLQDVGQQRNVLLREMLPNGFHVSVAIPFCELPEETDVVIQNFHHFLAEAQFTNLADDLVGFPT